MKQNSIYKKIEFNLRVPKYYKITWITIGLVTLFLGLLGTIAIIAIKAPTNPQIINNIQYNINLANIACIISYVSLGLIAIPYIFLSACWIVGIDNITKSAKFHIVIWIIYSLSATLSIISLLISFRTYINL